MKTHYKSEILKYGVYVLIVVATIIAAHLIINRKPVRIPDASPIPPVEMIEDANGEKVGLIKQYVSTIEQNKKLIDSLSNALSAQPKQVDGVDRIVTKIDTLWRDSIVYIPASSSDDSTIISRKDAYVEILAVGKPRGSYINFNLTPDTMFRTQITKSSFLHAPYTNIYIRHTNPYMETEYGSSFTVRQKTPMFSIGVSVGYDVVNNRVSIGPTITLPVKTFYK